MKVSANLQQRYILLDEQTGPRIFVIPANHTARAINECNHRKLKVFETLEAAKEAAMSIIDSLKPELSSLTDIRLSKNELRSAISNISENTVERFYLP